MVESIHEKFERELGEALITSFPAIQLSEPKWIEEHCELWYNRTQVWVDPLTDHSIMVTLMNEDYSWSVVMERNYIALIYLMIGFDNHPG